MTDQNKQTASSSYPKMWECGDPYIYPIPREEGNTWDQLLEPLMERDKARCDAWRDEVQNLLIFAGLFSGVLTGFLGRTYPSLQPDPNREIISLLTLIATRLDNPSLPTPNAAAISTFSANPSSIRINVFWSISLVLSLTTSLISIVSLQWLREHQHYSSSVSPMQKFALFTMREEGLKRWYVPQIFSTLPLLLQGALVLFLIGLIEFLLGFGIKVAIPVIIIIGIPLVFLILTTILPTLQATSFCLPLAGRTSTVPAQCPYKSTQSSVLRRSFILSKPAFRLYARIINGLYFTIIVFPLRPFGLFRSKESKSQKSKISSDAFEQKLVSDAIFKTWNAKTWLSFDEDWLAFRDIYAKSIFDGEWWMSFSNKHLSHQVGPLYDLTRGLQSITRHTNHSTIHFTIYHCIQELNTSVISNKFSSFDPESSSIVDTRHIQYFQTLLGSVDDLTKPLITFSSNLKEANRGMLHDENAFIHLAQYRFPSPVTLQHFAELHVRLVNYACTKSPRTLGTNASVQPLVYSHYQFLHSYGKGNRRPAKFQSPVFDPSILSQFSMTLESFFKAVLDPAITDSTFLSSYHAQPFGDTLRYLIIRQPDNTIPPILDLISSNLKAASGTSGIRSDFLFYAASFYARSLSISDPYRFEYSPQLDDIPAVTDFLPVLRQYLHRRGKPDVYLRARLGIPDSSDPWWDFLNRRPGGPADRLRRQDTLNVISSVSPRHVSSNTTLNTIPETQSEIEKGPGSHKPLNSDDFV